MDFFSCPCLLSEFTDWIKGIGLPQTLCVINISAGQMQNTADLRHRFKVCNHHFSPLLLRLSESFRWQKKTDFVSELKLFSYFLFCVVYSCFFFFLIGVKTENINYCWLQYCCFLSWCLKVDIVIYLINELLK